MPNGEPHEENGYNPHELVVELAHQDLVRAKIVELGLTVVDHDPGRFESPELDLALLDVGGVAGQEAADFNDHAANDSLTDLLRREVTRWENDEGNTTDAGTVPAEDDPSNLNRLLYCLRRMIGGENGDWFPAIGKNRHMESVAGQPHLSGTADEYPEPVGPPDVLVVDEGPTPVQVGILDTKLFKHRDLANVKAFPNSLLTDEDLENPLPHFAGHSTFITGLVHRYAPSAKLDVRWVLGNERAVATAWDVARAMVGFKGSGVRILCLALGGYSSDNKPPLVLTRAIDKLSPEIVVVAAAGNRARRNAAGDPPPRATDAGSPTSVDKRPIWPGADPDVVAVGAVGTDDKCKVVTADFSPTLAWMTLRAQGTDVVSTFLTGKVLIKREPPYSDCKADFREGYARWSGTSAAAAIVTGRLATIASHNGGDPGVALQVLLQEAATAPRKLTEGGVWPADLP